MHAHTRVHMQREEIMYNHRCKRVGSMGETERQALQVRDTAKHKKEFFWVEQLWVIFLITSFVLSCIFQHLCNIKLKKRKNTNLNGSSSLGRIMWCLLPSLYVPVAPYSLFHSIFFACCYIPRNCSNTGCGSKQNRKKSMPLWSLHCSKEQKTIK